MNNLLISLPTSLPSYPAQDYEQLRAEGIEWIQRLVGNIWTDYNAHDPGITILEQVCYAITDLAYRIDYDMADLLTRENADMDASLPSPRQILPSSPVTVADFRKLLIDIPGVKNAWVEPYTPEKPLYVEDDTLSFEQMDVTSDAIHLRGLYQVAVELDDLSYDETSVTKEVIARLHANRGLCEDFDKIEIIKPEWIRIKASVEIAQIEEAERILVDIYQRLANHISPPVPVYTLGEQIATSHSVDEIFDGPLLTNGFMDNDALRARHTVLHTSDLIREIMQVSGVLAVQHIEISNSTQPQAWSLSLNPKLAPKFDSERADITLEYNQRPLSVNTEHIRSAFQQRLIKQDSPNTNSQNDLKRTTGNNRHIETYHSIRDQFPTTYGLESLSELATLERQAQRHQLQAYLLFFDQILANCFAQLAHVSDLFAFDSLTDPDTHLPIPRTYFAQMVANSEAILKADLNYVQEMTENAFLSPEALTESQARFERRNRFLNHLLARFAENLNDFVALQDDLDPAELVAAKQLFLQQNTQLSRSRGLGSNLMLDQDNISTLEKRLRQKLGLGEATKIFIIEHILLRPLPGDEEQSIPLLVKPSYKDPYSLRLTVVLSEENNTQRKTLIEELVREETPAHLAVKVNWLNPQEMNDFSTAYNDWWQKYRQYRQTS